MNDPTDEELTAWYRDLELWQLVQNEQNSGLPPSAQQFGRDLTDLLDAIAQGRRGSLPTALVIRLARRLSYSLAPECEPQHARRIGVKMLRRILRRNKKFNIVVNKDWTNRYDRHVEDYHHTSLANGFVARTYELSKPGGVRDRLDAYQRGDLPRWAVEQDLAVHKPDGMTRVEALRHAAMEVANAARECFGYLPKRWEPNKSDRLLQQRYADLLRPHLAKGYFIEQDHVLHRPKLSLTALALPRGRPKRIRSTD